MYVLVRACVRACVRAGVRACMRVRLCMRVQLRKAEAPAGQTAALGGTAFVLNTEAFRDLKTRVRKAIPQQVSLNPKPRILNPTPYTLHTTHYTPLRVCSETLNPKLGETVGDVGVVCQGRVHHVSQLLPRIPHLHAGSVALQACPSWLLYGAGLSLSLHRSLALSLARALTPHTHMLVLSSIAHS